MHMCFVCIRVPTDPWTLQGEAVRAPIVERVTGLLARFENPMRTVPEELQRLTEVVGTETRVFTDTHNNFG